VWYFSDTLALHAIAFTDSLNGTVVGRYGRAYRTTNGGALWLPQAIPTRSHLNAVAFKGHDTGWIAGDEGTILKTTDGGSTWPGTVSGTMQSLKGIGVVDSLTQWIAGYAGTALRSRSTPSTSVPDIVDELPSTFALGQNFPNPFNPSSDIRYLISEFRMVQLAVYDLLGREVAMLVNEAKQPGAYSVRFNASGLASGVYLYRLTAGSFVETRKMIVLK
jgi:hypothetical protein